VVTAGVLVERARASASLSDLGPTGWQAGLDHLLAAVEHDVRDGDAVARIEALIVDRLVTRLRVEAWYSEHGAEARHRVEGPLVVLGLPRTGTTALHYLLSVDPQFRYLRSWELNEPVPPPDIATEATDPRRPREDPSPDVRHIAGVDGPAEDFPIHALAFDHAELTLPVPSHSRWWRTTARHDSLFPYHERILRLLHSHRPPEAWLLKMPAYLFLLPELASQYPDARFVMTHRDPVTVMASTCSTVAAARRKRTPTWSPDADFGPSLLEHWSEGMRSGMAARDALGEKSFIDVAQHELETDSLGVAERVYDRANLTINDEVRAAMVRWAAANQRGSRGSHRYTAEEYGLAPAEINESFALYLERFGELCAREG
jgi:hypothetical protein